MTCVDDDKITPAIGGQKSRISNTPTGYMRSIMLPNANHLEIVMASTHEPNNKVTRHRQRMRAAGLRPVQFWVPDTRNPEFAAQVRSQCQNLKGDPAEVDILRFIDEAATPVEGWE
jgi:hypothetical protein